MFGWDNFNLYFMMKGSSWRGRWTSALQWHLCRAPTGQQWCRLSGTRHRWLHPVGTQKHKNSSHFSQNSSLNTIILIIQWYSSRFGCILTRRDQMLLLCFLLTRKGLPHLMELNLNTFYELTSISPGNLLSVCYEKGPKFLPCLENPSNMKSEQQLRS